MIKKIVALFSALVLGVSLTACSGGSEETTTLVGSPQKGITSEITYYHVGDKVIKQTLKNTITFAELEGIDKDMVVEKIKEVSKGYNDVQGIEHDLKISDTEIVETGTIDFEKLDFKEASKIPGLLVSGDPEQGISLDLSVKGLEGIGYKKK